MGKEITPEEYVKAEETIQRYKIQQDKTIYADVIYKATVDVQVKVPQDWSPKKIIEELKDGYWDFDYEEDTLRNPTLQGIDEIYIDGVGYDLDGKEIDY